jgi:hypothetical protein
VCLPSAAEGNQHDYGSRCGKPAGTPTFADRRAAARPLAVARKRCARVGPKREPGGTHRC